MKKNSLILVFLSILTALFFSLLNNEKLQENTETVEIREVLEYKEYNFNSKKNINDIDYDDLKNIKISKKKFEEILEYKNIMGVIKKIDDLKNISRMSENDIYKLKQFFEDDNSNKEYKAININKASEKELRYMGFSKKSIEKIKSAKKISNMIDLKELIGNDNIVGNIDFTE